MNRYGHLFEKVTCFDNLIQAARKAGRGKKDRISVARFFFHLESEVLTLQDVLWSGTYRMQPYRAFVIHEPKPRKICAADFRDRVVHHAVCTVLDPIWDACMIRDTYACRRGRGTHAAVKRVQLFSRSMPYFLTCDVRRYFASIDHGVLKELLRRKIKDSVLLGLLDHFIDHPIPDGCPGKGIPIGNLTSQYFANLYLGELDHLLKERLRIKGYVRYMDDFIALSNDKPMLHETISAIRGFLRDRLLLELKDEAVRVAPVTEGIPFLGFRIFPGLLRLDGRKWARFRCRVKALEEQYRRGLLSEESLSRSIASMIGHVQHADSVSVRKKFFASSIHMG
jgi:retron-type reverse transcriptase